MVQKYIDPFLVDNLKFDLRVYVLVYGINPPMRLYLFKEGLVRFATQEYEDPSSDNKSNLFMHLTNYAINKQSENFEHGDGNGETGHKRSLVSLLKHLQQTQGISSEKIMNSISDIVIKTLVSVQPQLSQIYRSC